MKNQHVLFCVVFLIAVCAVLYNSSDWHHLMQTTHDYLRTNLTHIHDAAFNKALIQGDRSEHNNHHEEFNLESLPFWSDDQKCHQRIDSDLNMTSGLHSTFNISCDKQNSSCHVTIFAVSKSKARKRVGGDIFLLWAEQKQEDGRSVGNVTDNGDGTYTGEVRFYWRGATTIRVKLGCTLETFCRRKNAMLKYGNSAFALKKPWGMKALFQTNATKEETRCGIYDKIQGYTKLCNLTTLNDGIPWFCGKPNSEKLNCEDVYEYNEGNFMRLNGDPKPDSAEVISNFGHGLLKQTMTLSSGGKYEPPNLKCMNSSKRSSWFSSGGFYISGKWNIPYCKYKISFSKEAYRVCLRNKTVVFLGDSTVREYATFFLSKTIALPLIDLKNRKSKNRTYHPESEFEQYGVRIIYKKHELPFHHPHVPIDGITSLGTELTKIAHSPIGGDDLIVLINYNSHMHAYPPDQIRIRLKRIATALEYLLNKKPTAHIFIRGPHVHFNNARFFDLRVSLIEKDIIYQEFKHLLDKIVYLDTWSITTAFNSEDLHPRNNALNSQIQQFMAYICYD